MIIKSLLDTDLYKLTMGQFAFHKHKGKIVKYQFVCRNKDIDLSPYKEEIEKEIDGLIKLKFSKEEINYLGTISGGIFKRDYLSYLSQFSLERSQIKVFVDNKTLKIEAEGPWESSIFWEVYVLSIVNEVYFRNTQPNADMSGARKTLYENINIVKTLNNANTDKFSFMEFGTRRRYSAKWQKEVCEILEKELGGNGFVGTSNVYLAMNLKLKVHGTMAHEMFQFHQGIKIGSGKYSSYYESQENTLVSWLEEYQGKLSIALSDIFGTDAFLSILNEDLTKRYQGLRHDSGDPYIWGEKVISHYEKNGINPKNKTLVFSDSLDFNSAKNIFMQFKGRTNIVFGIGTKLTNSFDFKALNIVMKMIEADGSPVVKISDESTKAIGNNDIIQIIKEKFNI